MTDGELTKLPDQEFFYRFPLYFVGKLVADQDSQQSIPAQIDIVELDDCRCLVLFTEQSLAERHRAEYFNDGEICVLAATQDLRKHCEELQQSFGATHIMFDPTDQDSMVIPISQFIG